MAAGERAKCRQQADFCTKVKTRQTQPLAGPTHDHHSRVDMARQHIRAGDRVRVVCQRQPGQPGQTKGLIDAFDSPIGGRIASLAVVVATHQQHVQLRVLPSPVGHGGQDGRAAPVPGVQQVTEENDTPGVGGREQRVQAIQALGRGAAGHGNPEPAKGLGFANVHISHQQGVLVWQMNGSLREQAQPRATLGQFDRRAQDDKRAKASSRCSVGRRLKPVRA